MPSKEKTQDQKPELVKKSSSKDLQSYKEKVLEVQQSEPNKAAIKDIPTLPSLIIDGDHKHTELIRHYSNLTIAKALQSNSLSIYRMSVDIYTHDQVVDGISALFIATAMYFDENSLSSSQAKIVSEELLAHKETLKLEDLVVICKELKEQSVYSKLTPSKILKHVADYRNRRMTSAIKLNLNKTLDEKYEANIDDRIKRSIRAIEDSNRIISEKNVQMKKFYK